MIRSVTFSLKKDGQRLLAAVLSALIIAININNFVKVGELFPGGATGLTVLIQLSAAQFFGISVPYTLINIILNAFPVYIGFRFLGKKFTLFSLVTILLSGFFTDLLPSYTITSDPLLISVFGGILGGIAASISLLAGSTTGGTDFIAIYLSEKRKIDAFNTILYFNIGLLCVAGFLFGWDKAMYSIIFQYTATQVVHLLYRKYQQQTLFIVTEMPDAVCKAISDVSNHGATVLHGEGAYEHADKAMVYSVVSRAENKQVIEAIQEVDREAFINEVRTDELKGRFFYKKED